MKCPCIDCEKKGCGAYHDKCEPFKEWSRQNEESRKRRAMDRRDLSRDLEMKYRRKLRMRK